MSVVEAHGELYDEASFDLMVLEAVYSTDGGSSSYPHLDDIVWAMRGASKSSVRKALTRLANRGEVFKHSTGMWLPCVEGARWCRTVDDTDAFAFLPSNTRLYRQPTARFPTRRRGLWWWPERKFVAHFRSPDGQSEVTATSPEAQLVLIFPPALP